MSDDAERAKIVEVLTRLFVGTDDRDWPAVKRCFAPAVRFDMSSAGGGPASLKSPGEIVSAWDAGLKPIQAVHHQVGNFLVDVAGSRATASCHGVAYHHLPRADGRSTRTFVGTYAFDLERSDETWRIAGFKFNLRFIDGNLDLEKTESGSRSAGTPLARLLLDSGFRQIPVSVSGVGHLHAAGTLNERPVSVLLDTGGASTVVHLGLAREMGLKLTKLPFQGGGAGAGRLDVFELHGATFRMRDLTPRLRALVAMDLSHVNEALADKGQSAVDVIVGADVFEAHAAVIDYGTHSLFLKS